MRLLDEALNREWKFGPAHYQHVQALKQAQGQQVMNPLLAENWEKAVSFGETRFEVEVKSLTPSRKAIECQDVEYNHSRAAGYLKKG